MYDEFSPDQAQQQHEAALRAEMEEVYRRIPAWREKNTRLPELEAVIEHAKASGFQEGELRAIGAREWDALRKSWLADGRPLTSQQNQQRIERAAKRLRDSGRVKDAATAIERMLDARDKGKR